MSESKIKILIIDDSEFVLEVTRFHLEEAGYEVITRDTPFGGFAAILRETPELVLLDLSMPGLDGEMLAEIVKEQSSSVQERIVFFSDRSEDELKSLVKRAGVKGFIHKTDDANELLAQVQRFLT